MSATAPAPLTVEPVGAVHVGLFRGRHLLAKAPRDHVGVLRSIAHDANIATELLVALRAIADPTVRVDGTFAAIAIDRFRVIARAAIAAAEGG